MNDAFLDLKMSKKYPGFSLEIDASFSTGITAVFGPSGSGKTTILDCIAGLSTPDEGEVRLRARPLFSSSRKLNLRPEQRRVGYMFQESLLFPHYRVRENILYGFKLTPPERRKVELEQLVELLELGQLMERRPSNLSTGERQRVALARALATSPELLLMDEPLASLDIALRGRILRYLKDLHRELAIPMIYVSHSISEVLAIADSALVISHGRQLAFDEPRKVLLEPFVHSLVETGSLENLLDVEVVERSTGKRLAGAKIGRHPPLGAGDTRPRGGRRHHIHIHQGRRHHRGGGPALAYKRSERPQGPHRGDSPDRRQRAAVRRHRGLIAGGNHG